MDVKELRIGNLVSMKKGKDVITVEAITEFGVNREYGETVYDIEELEPIPLTEEWLVKMGFMQNPQKRFGHIYRNKIGVSLCVFKDPFFVSLTNYKDIIHVPYGQGQIKYVHSLQNLYFALTGEELEIKNP